jgi:hypothetical protein
MPENLTICTGKDALMRQLGDSTGDSVRDFADRD